MSKKQLPIDLHSSITWNSFEKFRTSGAKSLNFLKNGNIGTLRTKTGQYKIVEERDFQRLLSLVRDVERFQGGLNCILRAVRVLQKHPDRESIDLLLENISLLSNLTVLPIGKNYDALEPDSDYLDKDNRINIHTD